VKELTDSYDVISDAAALRTRLATDGYLFFRGLLPPHYHPDVPDFPTLTRGWTSTACIEVPAGVNFVDRWDPRVDDVPTPQSRFSYA
jgi:hypothetical protein